MSRICDAITPWLENDRWRIFPVTNVQNKGIRNWLPDQIAHHHSTVRIVSNMYTYVMLWYIIKLWNQHMKNLMHFLIMYLKIIMKTIAIFHQICGQIFQQHENEQQTVANRVTENLIHDFIPSTQIFFLSIEKLKEIQCDTYIK